MNKVILMGRLTRDPDIRFSQGQDGQQSCIARYTLAVDRRKSASQEQKEADFISLVAFGKSGEFAQKYLHQGSKICVTGRIQTGSYTNKEGQKVYTTDVVVEEQEFCESKSAQEGRSTGQQAPYPGGAPAPAQYQQNGYQQTGYQQQNGYPGGQQAPYQAPQQNGYQQAGYQQTGYQQGVYDNNGFMNNIDGSTDETLPFG